MNRLGEERDDAEGKYGDDLTIILGAGHLSNKTSVYLHKHKQWCSCVIDMTVRNAFDRHGHYKHDPNKLALLLYIVVANSGHTKAWVPTDDKWMLGFKSGMDIYIQPNELASRNHLAPLQMRDEITADTDLDDLVRLPALVFHELSRTRVAETHSTCLQRTRDTANLDSGIHEFRSCCHP
jgi:hypothetical protein